jgi:hypothetical protein
MAHRSDDDAAVHTVAPNALKPFSQTACPLGCELTVKAQNASFRTIESRRSGGPLPRIFDLQLIGRMSPFDPGCVKTPFRCYDSLVILRGN